MRARGLKLIISPELSLVFAVAPHAGAWIETRRGQILGIRQGSRLMRARGLKPWDDEKQELGHWVAPHAGAWIETERR